MIYLDPLQLGWDPLIKSWMENDLPQNLNEEQKETIKVCCVRLDNNSPCCFMTLICVAIYLTIFCYVALENC